ncbi:MAG: DUF1801 domain-containing protein [Pseudomonadota bacterium]
MTKSENKIQPTAMDPRAFVEAVDHPVRRADGLAMLDLFGRVTGLQPKMWGPSIIGYGRYAYKYDSGREGESLMTGFSPRKANMVLYIMPGYENDKSRDMLARLGKHKLGKSCLYITKLANVDEDVLVEIISAGVEEMRARYETWDM